MPAFTDNFPRYQSYVLKHRYIRSPRGKKTSPAAQLPYEFKIALVEQSLQPGACVARSPGKTESTITCSSTGAINTERWPAAFRKKYAGTASRDVKPEPDNKIPAPAQEPEQINTRPTVCVVSWFCRPELSGLKVTDAGVITDTYPRNKREQPLIYLSLQVRVSGWLQVSPICERL